MTSLVNIAMIMKKALALQTAGRIGEIPSTYYQ